MNKPRVLVVEDSYISSKLLDIQLKRNWFDVHTVDDWLSAIAIMETEKFSLILMDIVMQWMDWIETTKIIRRNDIAIKIIWIWWSEEDKIASIEAGMDNFLTKPISIDSLLKLINS